MITERSIKESPFCWAAKSALRRITETTGESQETACRVRSTYLALCELASDEGQETFVASKSLIAYRAGLSIRTVQRVFPDLERAGVLRVKRNAYGPKTASGYTLLSVTNATSHPDSTTSHPDSSIGHGRGSRLADKVEERKEKEDLLAPIGAIGGMTFAHSKPRKSRDRSPLLDALAQIDGAHPSQVTNSAWGAIGKSLAEIREVCPEVGPEEIHRRAANYSRHFPDARLTPLALAKHWARCDRQPHAPSARREAAVRRIDLTDATE